MEWMLGGIVALAAVAVATVIAVARSGGATKAWNYQRFLDVSAGVQEWTYDTWREATSVSVRPARRVDAPTLVDRLHTWLPDGAEARSMPRPAS